MTTVATTKCSRTVQPEVIKHIKDVLDYNWRDEEKQFQVNRDDSSHIFHSLLAIRNWLDESSKATVAVRTYLTTPVYISGCDTTVCEKFDSHVEYYPADCPHLVVSHHDRMDQWSIAQQLRILAIQLEEESNPEYPGCKPKSKQNIAIGNGS